MYPARCVAVLLLSLLFANVACPSESASSGTDNDRDAAFSKALVHAPDAVYQGTVDSGFSVFKGIPYAQPPVGDLRWKPPVPAEKNTAVVDATRYGPASAQNALAGDVLDIAAPKDQSEDCLHLNVWSPAHAANASLPVMVWIHGGWFARGSSRQYPSGVLAKKGNVVVVTLDYRLGPFGFLAHPRLTAESPDHSSGNDGLRDQIAALQWVRRNIQAFGGDPDRVTIFGQSAGGYSVCYLLASPLTKGLFRAAIMQSGTCELRGPQPARRAEQLGIRLSNTVQCEDTRDVLACLRQKSTAEILAALPSSATLRSPVNYRPNQDGEVLPGSARQLIIDGAGKNIPVMIGSTIDDASRFVPSTSTREEWADYVRKRWPKLADTILALYPADTDADAHAVAVRAATEMVFGCSALATAKAIAGNGTPVYLYLFTYVPERGRRLKIGAFHAAELPYVFGNLNQTNSPGYGPDDVRLSDALIAIWSRFAATGDPNGPGLPAWPRYVPTADTIQEIGLEQQHVANPEARDCSALQRLGLQ
ncbi:carboxylesterase/lipase family protein [Pararobbsia silviterrae]|nr:carboxylesterase/lipase family protein [Pararobbsia silviterrae]